MSNPKFYDPDIDEKLFLGYGHPEKKLPSKKEMFVTFNLHHVMVDVHTKIPAKELQKVHYHLLKAVNLIATSPLSKALSLSHVVICDRDTAKKRYGIVIGPTEVALTYTWHSSSSFPKIFVPTDSKIQSHPLWQAIVHEYGHHFFHRNLSGKFDALDEYEAIFELVHSEKSDKLPQIGDPLSDLGSTNDWIVKMASTDNFYLTKIIPNTAYLYTNSETGETIELGFDNVMKRLFRPSQYGSESFSEFMAEMFVLVVAGKNMGNSLITKKIQKNEQWLVDKFIEIATKYNVI